MKHKLRLLSVLLIFVTAIAFLPACSTESAAKISSPALVSKVTEYTLDYSTDEPSWAEQSVSEYTYKDGYPVSRNFSEHEGEYATFTEFKYEFKDGVPSRMYLTTKEAETSSETIYSKKGRVNRVRTYDTTGRKIGEQVFEYGNRDEYFTLVLHENIISPPDEKVLDHMEEIDSVIITTENGLLRKSVNDGLFANYNDNEEKVWKRFDGTYTANYDANGILDYTTALFKTFPGSGKQYKFDLTIKDGRVAEATRSSWLAEVPEDGSEASEDAGTWEPEAKWVFEYTDEEISPARYASMINYFIADGGGNYYIYNWY